MFTDGKTVEYAGGVISKITEADTSQFIFDIKTKRIQKGKIGFIVEDSFENQTGEEAVLISISGIPVVEILKKSVITLDEFLLKNTLSEES